MGDKISKDEAMTELSQLRSGGGGGTSMFAPMLGDIEDLGEDEVFTDTVDGYGRVSGLRRYVKNNADGNFEVKSAKTPNQEDVDQSDAEYKVFVFRSEE
jgi:hypothetical protein